MWGLPRPTGVKVGQSEGCKLDPCIRSRGARICFSRIHCFDLKLEWKKSGSSEVLATHSRALVGLARTSPKRFARTTLE